MSKLERAETPAVTTGRKIGQTEGNFSPLTSACFLLLLLFVPVTFASDAEALLTGMQKRYASADTIAGTFRLNVEIPGFQQQAEYGEFRLKKPGKMLWEYRHPEGQFFILNGEKSYFYVPEDNQVTIQSLSADELHNTPLRFLLGSGDIKKSYFITPEREFDSRTEGTESIRLSPKNNDMVYSFLILDIDQKTYDLRRLVAREPGGDTLEYLFHDIRVDVRVDEDVFLFKKPKGAEILRIENEE